MTVLQRNTQAYTCTTPNYYLCLIFFFHMYVCFTHKREIRDTLRLVACVHLPESSLVSSATSWHGIGLVRPHTKPFFSPRCTYSCINCTRSTNFLCCTPFSACQYKIKREIRGGIHTVFVDHHTAAKSTQHLCYFQSLLFTWTKIFPWSSGRILYWCTFPWCL